jgi:hypothetical protein
LFLLGIINILWLYATTILKDNSIFLELNLFQYQNMPYNAIIYFRKHYN